MAITSNGDMIVTENRHHCVAFYNKKGNKIRQFGSQGSLSGQFSYPNGVVVTADSHILVADSANKRIQKLTMTGEPVTSVRVIPLGFLSLIGQSDFVYIPQERYSLLTNGSIMSKSSMLISPSLICLAVPDLLRDSSSTLGM